MAMYDILAVQVAAIQARITALLAEDATVAAAGVGPTYSKGGPNGSESLDMAGYRRYIGEQIDRYLEEQSKLIDKMQDLVPYLELQRVRVGGSMLGGR